MIAADASLTAAQREFADAHDVGRVVKSFSVGSMYMYHSDVAFTDRWLVRRDGSTAEHIRFEYA
jgi:hypothetical protein